MHTGKAQGADEGTVQTFPVKIMDGRIWLSPDSEQNRQMAANE